VDPRAIAYTNDPYDNQKRKEAFETYGFDEGSKCSREDSRDCSLLSRIVDAGSESLCVFLPLALAGFATAIISVSSC